MIEVAVLAIALSMDAFAVSISLGAKKRTSLLYTALLCAIYFGFFQGAMPLLGYLAGAQFSNTLGQYTDWIAAALLLFIGAKMIKEALDGDPADEVKQLSHSVMLLLAIATSIDALAAGFALLVFDMSIWLAALIIALITAFFSFLGVWIGNHGATWLESKAEWLGGLVLIALGFKVLLN